MAKLPTRRKVFDLAGEAQTNADGSSRQSELLICEPGEAVALRREPDNVYDANAISVFSVRGVCIGYLAKADAADIAPILDLGRRHSAKIHELRGGVSGYTSYGARVSIAWDDAKPHPHIPLDEAQQKTRHGKRSMAGRERDASGRLTSKAKSSGGCMALCLGLTSIGGALISWFGFSTF